MDLRGHGESDKPDQDYTINGFVDDVAWLCGKIGLEKPVVIGHSMGGVIGMNLARKHPELATRARDGGLAGHTPSGSAAARTRGHTGRPSITGVYGDTAKGFVATFMFNATTLTRSLKSSIIAGMSAAPQRLMCTALGDTVAPANLVPGPIPVPSLFIRATTQFANARPDPRALPRHSRS